MAGLFETFVAVAATFFAPNPTATTYEFPDGGQAVGETQIVILSTHATVAPFPQHPGWTKISEVVSLSASGGLKAGARVAAYSRVRQAGDGAYVFYSGTPPMDMGDPRAEGILVSVSGPVRRIAAEGTTGEFIFAPEQAFLPPQALYTSSATAEDLIVYGAFDNTERYGKDVGPVVTDGIATHMPVVKPTETGPVYLEFNFDRVEPLYPRHSNKYVFGYYGAMWVKLTPTTPLKPRK